MLSEEGLDNSQDAVKDYPMACDNIMEVDAIGLARDLDMNFEGM